MSSLAISASVQPPAMNRSILPAHDFMGEQHSAHLRVLVLSFVSYGLQK